MARATAARERRGKSSHKTSGYTVKTLTNGRVGNGSGNDVAAYPITIFVSGPSRCNNRSIADCVIETQPAVGPKFSRAR